MQYFKNWTNCQHSTLKASHCMNHDTLFNRQNNKYDINNSQFEIQIRKDNLLT